MLVVSDALRMPLNAQDEPLVSSFQRLDNTVVGEGHRLKALADEVRMRGLMVIGVDRYPVLPEEAGQNPPGSDFHIVIPIVGMRRSCMTMRARIMFDSA